MRALTLTLMLALALAALATAPGGLALAQEPIRLTPITIRSTPMSPGALVVLTVTGLPLAPRPLPEPLTPTGPWRKQFGDLSVMLISDPADGGPSEQSLPIAMASSSSGSCGIDLDGKAVPVSTECLTTEIIVQMPLTIRPNANVLGGAARHLLWLEGPGWRSSRTFRTVVPSAVNILTACSGLYDSLTSGCEPFPRFDREGERIGVVRPGDKISLYATGLGKLRPGHRAVIGEPVTEEAETALDYRLAFEYRGTAPLRTMRQELFHSLVRLPGWIVVEPTYVGLQPGTIGVYRIDFRIPEPPPGALSCGSEGVGVAGRADLGNLSLTVFSTATDSSMLSDSIGLCVDTMP